MKTLSISDQIEILEEAKTRLKEEINREGWKAFKCDITSYGLCNVVVRIIFSKSNKSLFLPMSQIKEFIPLFTLENAREFGESLCINPLRFWWPLTKKGFQLRIEFLDWMINELEKTSNKPIKQLNNEES